MDPENMTTCYIGGSLPAVDRTRDMCCTPSFPVCLSYRWNPVDLGKPPDNGGMLFTRRDMSSTVSYSANTHVRMSL